MAAKWQQWMPLHIDRWRGSPAVKAMHPTAQMGYLNLLMSQWQSEDCSLSGDPLDLAEKSELGDELWAVHGLRILRKFDQVNGNVRVRNSVCFEDWMEAKRIFEARQQAAVRTTKTRHKSNKTTVTVPKSDGDRDGLLGGALRSPDTITGTVTSTEEQKQKPSRAKAARVKTEPTKTDLAKARHADFKAAVGKYWDHKNPGIQMPWDGREGKHLEMFLRAAPQITLPQFRGFLNNRAKSEVNHGERPSQWIDWVTSYSAGPMDKFGKTIGGTNGANHISPTKQRVAANLAALGEAAKRRGLGPLDGFGGADAQALPLARPDGLSGGPDQRLRSTGPEILPPEG